jgi:cytochrome c oxidase subunit 1
MNIFSKENKGITTAKYWFWLGVVSLALAGLFAVLLVGARSPGFVNIMPYKEFFKTALIVHVNLSVFVWLTAFTASLWSLTSNHDSIMEKFYFSISCIGTALMSISPFLDEGNPLLNNYFPILENFYFELGLGLFALGLFLKNVSLLIFGLPKTGDVFGFGVYVSGLITMTAFAHYLFSHNIISAPEIASLYNSEDYYNRLFWAPGHILQYAYTQLIIIAWVLMAMVIGYVRVHKTGFLKAIFAVNFILVLPTFMVFNKYEITSFEFMNYFTKHMISGGGIAAVLAFAVLVYGFFRNKTTHHPSAIPIRNNLFWSIILFGAGGIIGMMITQENTKVPAHYHGSIVGVSIAVMGVAFYLMPKFGYGEITGRLANWQGGLYGFGQLLHIIGFAISGGYGALRKTPAVMQSFEGKLAMGMMGLGGLISIIGGLVFVVIIFKSIKSRNEVI